MANFVGGRGAVPADILLCGEAPGKEEDRAGKPFIGKTGKETERLLREAGLDLRDVYWTNIVKYRPYNPRPTGNVAPSSEEIARDAPLLIEEIRKVRPKWIAAVGRIAARWFFERDVDMEDCSGFAFPDLPRAQGAVVIPVLHPAAGFHQPENQPYIHRDFMRLGQFVRGELEPVPPVDQYPDPDYYEVRSSISVPKTADVIAVDTEGLKGQVWCATYAWHPGTGGLVRAGNKQAVKAFKQVLLSKHVLLHNAPHDLRILSELLGMPLLDLMQSMTFDDTMQLAYTTRLLPKGLKALGRRLKGVEMESYQSVIAHADRQIMIDWLRKALTYKCSVCSGLGTVEHEPVSQKTGKKLQARLVKCAVCEGDGTAWNPPTERVQYKNGKVVISRGHRMGSRIRGILKDVDKADTETGQLVDLRDRWNKLKKDNHEFAVQVEQRTGPPRQATLEDVPFDRALTYACRDADVTMRIWPELEKEVKDRELWPVYEMDRNVIPMITRMMDVGWQIDVPYLNVLSNRLEIQQDRVLYQLEELVGRPINPNSTEQVGQFLFDELGLHPVRITDAGGESTDAKVLADLQIQCNVKQDQSNRHRRGYQFITGVLEYKERGTLRSRYTLELPKLIDDSSRVHTTLSNVATESGRLNSKDPNLQNLPSRTENGRLIRGAFTCGEENVLLECDYSQIEFRLMAHAAQEKTLIKAINDGLDPHNLTTSKIFSIPFAQVQKGMWQRDAGKTLGFLILYGGGAANLKTQIKLQSAKHTRGGMDIPLEQCQVWIDDYTMTTYPAIGEFMQDSQAEARRYGYVQDMFGRPRYLPGVKSKIGSVRAEAERIATNHKIQAGAQGIIKLAMAVIDREVLPKFRQRGYCEPLMQVHDSLVFEVSRQLVEELKQQVVKVMRGVVSLDVKIDVDGKIGSRWNQLS